MDPSHNSVFDYVYVFAPIFLIFVTCFTVFHRLRMRWPAKVNCWFCNKNTKIWRQNLDWWLCPCCEQYNGFSKNGDYTYDIPEQYETLGMCTKYSRLDKQSYMHNVPKNSLCMDCNKLESLKLLELSNFEPKIEKHYDVELKAFKKYLEKRYPLCSNCKSTVQDVLSKQALWLTHYKMLFFRQKPIKALISNARKSETIFRIISIILNLIITYNHDFIWLPIGGLFSHLCACWASLKKRKNSDVILILLWFCIILLVSVKNLTAFQNIWLTIEHIMQYHIIKVCTFIIGFISLKPSSYKNALTGSVAFKKLKLHNPATSQSIYNSHSKNNNILNERNNNIESSVTAASELSSTEITSDLAILKQKLSTTTASNSNCSHRNFFQNKNSPLDSYCLNDSLSTLFLNENSPRRNENTKTSPTIFERRIYSATSSENLFKKSSNTFNRKHILSPPKLKSVTQTSWVAGGYWHEGMVTTPPTLSRSSSQSSGFGSAGSSNLAPSREPSVHELDRCSIVSDATRWSHSYHTPHPVFRMQSQRHDTTRNYSPQSMASLARATCNVESHVQERHVRGLNVGNVMPVVPGHTTTVVASPGWLSALLCGSLILNMIVLCTTLLR